MGVAGEVAVFADTNLGTRIAFNAHQDITAGALKRDFERLHFRCLPDTGEIQVDGLMVKRKSSFYYLPDSLRIKHVFPEMRRTWFLHVEVKHSKCLCIPCSPHDGDAVILSKPQDMVTCNSEDKAICDTEEGFHENYMQNTASRMPEEEKPIGMTNKSQHLRAKNNIEIPVKLHANSIQGSLSKMSTQVVSVTALDLFSKIMLENDDERSGECSLQFLWDCQINLLRHRLLYFLGQFNLQKFISSVKSSEEKPAQVSSWFKTIGKQLQHKSLYALGLFSEFQLTPDDTLHLGVDYTNKPRGKAVLHHKFPSHDLTVEAVYPGLFVDKTGNYWDVPLSMAVDVASVSGNDSSTSYHLSAHYNKGEPEQFDRIRNQSGEVPVPPALLPGLAFRSAFSYRKKVDIWRSEAPKLKSVQPYDIFLSNPHVSASGSIGAASTTHIGENSERAMGNGDSSGIVLQASGIKTSFLADTFASVSLTAQLGYFQKRFLDLTRFHCQLNIPSGTKFLSGLKNLARDYTNIRKFYLEDLQAICPNATLSFQQQIAGPVSFRVDSGIGIDLRDPKIIRPKESVFAIEYALQVLGSAKAVAWYCPQRQEFMAELRFYEK